MTQAAESLARAQIMLDLKRHDEAASVLGRIVAADPGNPAAWCLLAQAHIGAGRYQDALTSAGRAIAVAPDHDWPHRLACTAHLHLGNAGGALRAAEQARRLAPDTWQAHVCVADATLATNENFHLAADAAATARALAPDEPEVHVISGKVSFALARRRAARAHLERALALDPQHAGALNELGRVTLTGPFGGRAARYFLQAVHTDPRASTYSTNVDATVRRAVGIVIYLGDLAAVALYLATGMTHLSRAQILLGLAACVLLMTAAGAAQYLQLPPPARALARRRPSVPALAVSYAFFLVAFAMIGLSSAAALSNMLAGAIGIIIGSQLIIMLWLVRQTQRSPARNQRRK